MRRLPVLYMSYKVLYILILLSILLMLCYMLKCLNIPVSMFPCRMCGRYIFEMEDIRNSSVLELFVRFCDITSFQFMSENEFFMEWEKFKVRKSV